MLPSLPAMGQTTAPLSRDHLNVGDAAGAAVVDLDAIEMVLLAAISAGIGAGPEPAAIDGLQALAQLVRREAGVAPERQDRNLPDELGARRGIGSTQGDLANGVVLESGDKPLPDVEIDQRRALLEVPAATGPGVPSGCVRNVVRRLRRGCLGLARMKSPISVRVRMRASSSTSTMRAWTGATVEPGSASARLTYWLARKHRPSTDSSGSRTLLPGSTKLAGNHAASSSQRMPCT